MKTNEELVDKIASFFEKEDNWHALKECWLENGRSNDLRRLLHKAYEEVENFERMESKIKVLIYDIKWDTDGEKVNLPKKVEHTFDGYNDINDEDLLGEIAEWLTDEYEYCHGGFNVQEIEEV